MSVKKGKIYKILTKKEDKVTKPYVELFSEGYEMPSKLYGNIEKYATLLWNAFAKPGGRASAILVGKAGTGKTIFCKHVSNIAVKMGVDVFILEGRDHPKEVIDFIANVNNAVVFIDEFGKQFRWEQDQFLSLLSDTDRKRMFLFTENYMDYISEFILNRPGRVKFNFEFDTLESDTIREYCKDNEMSEKVTEYLLNLNSTNSNFCFDHMVNICNTIKELGVDDVEYVIEILNVPCLRKNLTFIPEKIVNKKTKLEYPLSKRPVNSQGIIVAELANERSMSLNENEKNDAKEFLKTFEEDYSNVDIHKVASLEDSSWEIKNRMSGRRLREGNWVKVSLSLENRLNDKGKSNEIVYRDITDKYEVYFKRDE